MDLETERKTRDTGTLVAQFGEHSRMLGQLTGLLWSRPDQTSRPSLVEIRLEATFGLTPGRSTKLSLAVINL